MKRVVVENGISYSVAVDDSARCDIVYNNVIPNCAICRGSLLEKCLDCMADNVEMYPVGKLMPVARQHVEYVAPFLHVFFRPVLTRDVINLIDERVTFSVDLAVGCPIVSGKCRPHTYHAHCIAKWRRKRDNCPLCNGPWVPDKDDAIATCVISGVKRIKSAEK